MILISFPFHLDYLSLRLCPVPGLYISLAGGPVLDVADKEI